MANKTSELRELKFNDLENRLAETRHELFNLRFKHATGTLDNSARLGQVKKDVARLETVLREREIAGLTDPEPAPVEKKSTRKAKKSTDAAAEEGK